MRPLAGAPHGAEAAVAVGGTDASPVDPNGTAGRQEGTAGEQGTPGGPEGTATASSGPPGSLWAPTTRRGRVLGALDDGGDRLFEPLRRIPPADTAARVLSNLADYGFAWAVLAAVKARKPGTSRRRAVVALAAAGVASAGVNTAVKRAVRRQRPPTLLGPAPAPDAADALSGPLLPVRRPRSSSFPSGHTLAAFCTAVVLPEGRAERSASVAFAAAVAASRVHLRAHHASDVVGGALIGTAVGIIVRRAVSALVDGTPT